MDNDVTKKLDLAPMSEEELALLRKQSKSLEDIGGTKDIKSDRLERFNLIKEKLKQDPMSSDVESELKAFKDQSKMQGALGDIQRKQAAVPNLELRDKLSDAVNAKRLQELEQATANKILTPSNADLPLQAIEDVGDTVRDIDLNAYRAAKLAEQAPEVSKFANIAKKIPLKALSKGAAKIGGKAAMGALTGGVSLLPDLLEPTEANAGSDMVPGRPSFEQLYGEDPERINRLKQMEEIQKAQQRALSELGRSKY